MMNKNLIRLIALLLCGLIILGVASVAFAEEIIYGNVIVINDLEGFLNFAQGCRLDSYSQGKFYYLNADIDLTGVDFEGIPIFCGKFDGRGHTISGLELTGAGSKVGLFRCLTETAEVKNLTVNGTVSPSGSRNYVGGIAGTNAGTVENCRFTGDLSGGDYVGGLVGRNEITGVIRNCGAEGTVHGNHYVGGIAGENQGIIDLCENDAKVNTTVVQNSVDISEITMDNLTGSESAITVTDIGGIAGISGGTVTSCVNRADVGYQYMGYNIGGIAGSQSGYISGCINYGRIHGRKEIGGIVGQMEPNTTISFETDTLQILRQHMEDLSASVKRLAANLQDNAATISSLITQLEQHIAGAESDLEQLKPDIENGQFNDLETTVSLLESLYAHIAGIESAAESLYAAIQNTTTVMESDILAMTEQVALMERTLDNASENLGGSVLDVSDEDTETDLRAKVEGCSNYGDVLGDLNVGGITGSIAVENDLDPEQDVDILGDTTLNYAVDIRAVILNCENNGGIQVRKQYGGGIAGRMSMGLVKNCVNTGDVNGGSADYVGGIAGYSRGFVRFCDAKCTISGGARVGGIVGEATVVSDCRSMVLLEEFEEMAGAIAGYAQELQQIVGNLYLVIGTDLGGIDGISYAGCAQNVSRSKFLEMYEESSVFHTVTWTFVFDDGTSKTVTVELGQSLDAGQIPAVPEKSGSVGQWDGLEEADLQQVYFDAVYTLRYTAMATVIESTLQSAAGLPVMLAAGRFMPDDMITVEEMDISVVPGNADAVAVWSFLLPESGTADSLRCLMPENFDGGKGIVWVRDAADSWREVAFTVSGSYLVFAVESGDNAICLSRMEDHTALIIGIGAAACLVAAVTVAVVLSVRRKKKG